tara:strand:- start:209 stop:382 length:174 start_codon:yes stop_codon:yes gene_type:complete
MVMANERAFGIDQKYGDHVLTDQLEQARGKGWNSIDCLKYEQFNKVEVIEENSEVLI